MKNLIYLLAFLLLPFTCFAQTTGTSTTVFAGTNDSTVANTTTETSLIGTGLGSTSVAANSMYAGRTYRFVIYGYFSTATILPSLTVRVKVGTVTLTSCAFSSLLGSLTAQEFSGVFTFTCRTVGASGSLMGQGNMSYTSSTLAITPSGQSRREDLKMTSAATIDTTAANTFDITAQWGTASASNTLTRTNVILEVLN